MIDILAKEKLKPINLALNVSGYQMIKESDIIAIEEVVGAGDQIVYKVRALNSGGNPFEFKISISADALARAKCCAEIEILEEESRD